MPLPTLPSAIDLSPFRSPPPLAATTPLSLFRPDFLCLAKKLLLVVAQQPLWRYQDPFNFRRKGITACVSSRRPSGGWGKFFVPRESEIRSRPTNETVRDRCSSARLLNFRDMMLLRREFSSILVDSRRPSGNDVHSKYKYHPGAIMTGLQSRPSPPLFPPEAVRYKRLAATADEGLERH